MKSSLIKTHAKTSITSIEADLLARVGIALVLQQREGWHVIDVTVESGLITLRGRVSSFYNRQLVVAVVRRVAGVMRVNDELVVSDRLLTPKREAVGLPRSTDDNRAAASAGFAPAHAETARLTA